MTIRVLVADDQNLVRTGLSMILNAQPDIEVVGEASDGIRAVALARELRPDVCLFDIRMPEMDGIEATMQIRQSLAPPLCDVPVVILTANVNTQDHQRCEQAGVDGLMVKPFDRVKLCALLEEQLLSSSTFLQNLGARSGV
jgi:DNA-binding NarL/FixJ family response regulator